MRSAVYEPSEAWVSSLRLTPSQIRKLPTSGKAHKPDVVKRLPSFPSGRMALFPFYRPVTAIGEPQPFMRAGSPIDSESGVYFIWNSKIRKMYIGSSIGTSKQGNVRRTLVRHWQSWKRRKPLSQYVTKFSGKGSRMPSPEQDRDLGGIVVPRFDIFVCVLLVKNDDKALYDRKRDIPAPRILEAWYYERLCANGKCLGINQIARDNPDTQLENVPF